MFAGLNDVKKVGLQNQKLILESSSQDAKNLILDNKNKILNYLKQYNIFELDVVVPENTQKKLEEKLNGLFNGKIDIE